MSTNTTNTRIDVYSRVTDRIIADLAGRPLLAETLECQ